MKNIFKFLVAIVMIISLGACGINTAMIQNQNQNSTQVHLAGKNYKTVEKITGSADVSYVLLIGGMDKTQLYENAYSAMMQNADLTNGSRAIINVLSEEQFSGLFPIAFKRTITVSAYVIEFTN